MILFDGGGRWIRTIEGIASRFTVCPLWPLGNSPILIFYLSRFSEQSPAQRVCEEKENGESGYKAFAASVEAECSALRLPMELVDGFEPPTC